MYSGHSKLKIKWLVSIWIEKIKNKNVQILIKKLEKTLNIRSQLIKIFTFLSNHIDYYKHSNY